jgi:hypothetical protein
MAKSKQKGKKKASGNKEENRARSNANLIPYKPGQSGNPNGRPKKRLIDQVLEELLLENDSQIAAVLAKIMLNKAGRGNAAAIDWVAKRTQGEPKRAHEVSGGDGDPIRLVMRHVADDDRKQ